MSLGQCHLSFVTGHLLSVTSYLRPHDPSPLELSKESKTFRDRPSSNGL